jgi:alcohol dehydrogenase class IV
MTQSDDNRDKTLSILRRAVREIEAGHCPEFIVLIYPHADDKMVSQILGFSSSDIRKAKAFNAKLEELSEEFQKQFTLRSMGVEESELDEVVSQLQKDLEKVTARALDKLKKDEPIKDVKQAAEMLRELMEKKS